MRLLALSVALLPYVVDVTGRVAHSPRCFTAYDTKKHSHVTTSEHYKTHTVTTTTTSTRMPSTTTTLPQATSTSSVDSTSTTTTTVPQSTDTFSTTTTFFSTSTQTDTSTSTSTSTTTTTTTLPPPTFTVPASAGFTPLASVVAAAGGQPSKRKRDAQVNRRAEALLERATTHEYCKPRPSDPSHTARYPRRVDCYGVFATTTTKTKTVKAPTSTATVTPTPYVTTTTSTFTSTSTVMLVDASTTTTFSTTSLVVETSTSTTTSTVTETATSTVTPDPVATDYAVCQPDNLITNYAPGQQFTAAGPDADASFSIGTASSGKDCCVQCVIAGSNCGSFLYYLDNTNTCVFLTPNTCDAGKSDGYLIINDGNEPDINGNSNCGQFRLSS